MRGFTKRNNLLPLQIHRWFWHVAEHTCPPTLGRPEKPENTVKGTMYQARETDLKIGQREPTLPAAIQVECIAMQFRIQSRPPMNLDHSS